MIIKQTSTFDTISNRALYGLNFIYSEFIPIKTEKTSNQSQRKLHELMEKIIDELYKNPELLALSTNKDEAYQWYEVNNMKPDLDSVYQSVFKNIFEFYKFLYISSLYGDIKDNSLSIDSAVLKKNKANYKPHYKDLLSNIGIGVIKEKMQVIISTKNDILQSLKLLSEKVPINVYPWSPFSLVNFACCSFTSDFSYLLQRVEKVNNLNGLLSDLKKQCLNKGYKQVIKCHMSATSIDFSISFDTEIGGFLLGYNPRKYGQFYFGTMNGIGEKAMLEDFRNLDNDLQEHFIKICKECNACSGCTKGGKHKIFALNINHNNKEYKLCPCFPQHNWETIDHNLIKVLFKYHDAQIKYGKKWKKKYP